MNQAARTALLRLLLSHPGEDRAQLRRELCLARGVHPDDIDPETGHDISRRAYEQVRAEWRQLAAGRPLDEYLQRDYAHARSRWEARRPQWTEGDNWLTDSPG